MAFLRQTWTLTKKNLLIVAVRHPLSTVLRAVLLPILFMFFISYAKNFFVPPSSYGIGSASPIRSLTDALNSAKGGRDTVVFVNNGHTGGDIENLIDRLSTTVRAAGKEVQVLDNDVELLTTCRSSLRGVSHCFAGASFHSSPTEGSGGIWNYTLRADGALGERIYVENNDNDAEIYILPFQHAVDSEIASLSGSSISSEVEEYPFTDETADEREVNIRHLYMRALINILAVAFFIGIVGVTYQLTGHMASERELGMSQLIEAMTPNRRGWHTQAARLLANHLAFDIIYIPSWIIMGVIMQALVFPTTNVGLIIVFHLLAGLSLSSFSIMGGSLFRKAQLSGITLVLVSIVLAIIAQVTHTRSSGAVAILSLLFPPMNYTYFIILIARFERRDMATNLAKGAPDSPWQLPGIVLWVFLVIQIFVFPIIGAFVEKALYGTASKSRKMTLDSAEGATAESIRLTNFTKHWQPSWWHRNVARRFGVKPKETVFAVNNLTLSAIRGQIMVLLGANGSGKSTTLDAISGLNTITSGSIEVDGNGGLGLCPQKNVMWDELTVYEHVKIFNSLKATKRDSKQQIENLIEACDLGIKLHAKSKTLSGGQKRKLQLAMMFTGGSRVCCVDEVSSGIDPLSRRKIWDILLAERGARTMLLTTHFLDEADFLSDYIVVLSKGNLKAKGSAVELKHNLGGGYRIILDNSVVTSPPQALENVQRTVLFDQTIYQIDDSAQAARLTDKLEREGINQYQVNGPTIEDVFLRVAEEVKEEVSQPDVVPTIKSVDSTEASETLEKEHLEMSTGRGTGFAKQTWVLFRKRLVILRRNHLPYIAAILIPIIAAGLVTLFLGSFSELSCDPGAASSNPTSYSIDSSEVSLLIPIGPSSAVSIDAVATSLGRNVSEFYLVETLADFNLYVQANYGSILPGGFFLNSTSAPTIAYIGNSNIYYAVLTQNLLSNVVSNTSIATQWQSFAVAWSPGAGDSLQLILYFGLAMCAFTGFFALYPTVERLRNVRALHYSNGIRAAPLWIAYTLFDFLFVLLVAVIVTVIFVGASSVWYYPGYLFVVFFLFGFTSLLLSYVVSLFVTSQLAAFAFMAGGQAVFFLIYFVIYMSIITYSEPADIDANITTAHFTFALITPAGNLLRALLLTLNEFSILCRGTSKAAYAGAISVYGGPVLYLIGQAAVLFIFLVWWDSGYKPAFLVRNNRRHTDLEETEDLDEDIVAEVKRVEQSNDRLRVMHLSKHFGSNTAVQDITFGIREGECFALLGPNGAGKSTTISLIRGDTRPSHKGGDVFVDDLSVTARRAAARSHLGVCPQFDAMDQMTVLEHLRFYARARGVPDIERNVRAVLAAVGLNAFQNRMAAKLSGGNKRKLSLGIALMGNPSVLLLDEPSSGMDAAAKRVMWRTLQTVTGGRALLITTHSMEEADALADRAGIMARKMLALGTSEELRSHWGDGWVVHLVHRTAPHTSDEDTQAMKEWVERNVPGAVLDPRMAHGQVRFTAPSTTVEPSSAAAPPRYDSVNVAPKSVGDDTPSQPQSGGAMSIANLFALLERNKESVGMAYYSVGRTTLDQVFLSIVGKHNVQEEGHEAEKKKRSKGVVVRLLRR